MERVTVTLTKNQISAILSGMELYQDLPMSHPENAFLMRIFNKLEKALAKS